MSSSDKSLLKDNYLYKLKGVSKWFINIMIVHLIFSVISLNVGGMYFTGGGGVDIEIQSIVQYGELIFVSVCALITTGYCLGEEGFRKMSITVPTTRKIESFSNLMLIASISVFTTISILMMENFKLMLIYFGQLDKLKYDEVYMVMNISPSHAFGMSIKILIGLVLAGVIGYTFSLLKTNYRRGLYIGITTFILTIIGLGYIGYEFALLNVIIDFILMLSSTEYIVIGILSIAIISAVSNKIIQKGDVL